jgi:hypothetical protein
MSPCLGYNPKLRSCERQHRAPTDLDPARTEFAYLSIVRQCLESSLSILTLIFLAHPLHLWALRIGGPAQPWRRCFDS